MTRKYLAIIVAIIFMMISLGCISQEKNEKQTPIVTPITTPVDTTVSSSEKNIQSLPQSIDKYYENEPVYLYKMWDLGGTIMGIVANLQQKDINNTKNSFTAFSKLYTESAGLVPEWSRYYNIEAVDKLGNALNSGNPEEIFPALDEVGKTCGTCHREVKPMVWARYHWKDFRKVNMSTGNSQEPELPWAAAKMKYLAPAFDGTIVNIKEGQQNYAADSWNQFNTAFSNLEKACLNCHKEPPRYFVSQDVKSLISQAGQQITAGALNEAEETMKQIGDSCYRCHIIHEPAQRIRESMER
jgi:cytochrome c556